MGAAGRVLLSALILALAACSNSSSVTETPVTVDKPPITLSERLAAKGFGLGDPVFVRIFKEEAELELWMRRGERYELFRTYAICKYSGGLGPKIRQGDRQAPEGFYAVGKRHLNPNSQFHKSFNLGFPNAYDRAHGRTGDYLMVHGACVSAGCYAMTDHLIEEIYTLVEAALDRGQPFFRVHALPFRLTEANLIRHADSRWIGFWRNLKSGYDWFETHRVPPDAGVADGQYVFQASGDEPLVQRMADAAALSTAAHQ